MKYCTTCNAVIDNDAANFCPACGAVQNSAVSAVPPEALAASYPSAAPTYAPPEALAASYPSAAPTYAPPEALCQAGMHTLVQAFSTKLFLAMCILSSFNIILGFLTTFLDTYAVSSFANFSDSFFSIATTGVGMTISMLLAQIFPILLCVSLWMTRSAALRAPATGRFDFKGLRMYRSTTIASLIVFIVLMSLAVVLSVFAAILLGTMGLADLLPMDPAIAAVLPMLIFMFVVFFGLSLALSLVMLLKQLKTITSICATAATGYPTTYVSMFVIVMYFISGGCSALLSLILLFSAFTASGLVPFLVMASSTASSFVFAVALLKYKKAMQAVLYSGGASVPRQ